MPALTITIDMDKACVKCGKKGATDSGLCLDCIAERIKDCLPINFTDRKKDKHE